MENKKTKSEDVSVKENFKNQTTFQAIKNAFYGIEHVLKTEANIKKQLIITILVLIFGIAFNLTRMEIVLVLFSIIFVIVTEMINTAIEANVDLYTDLYNPKAKIAKDVAAGAVVISTINAVVVGYFIFFENLVLKGGKFFNRIIKRPDVSLIVVLFLFIISAILIRVFSKKNKTLIPSGQAMIAFAIFTAVWTLTTSKEILALTLMLTAMVTINALKSENKTLKEIIIGAFLGIYGHSFIRELTYLSIHSFLHILGYDHIIESDKKIMREKEKEILKDLQI